MRLSAIGPPGSEQMADDPAVGQSRACGQRAPAGHPAGPVSYVPPGRLDPTRAGLPHPTVAAADTP
jgi:hypothetical protein